jgi:mannose-1-phosphate guanylyltransferase
LTPDVRGRYVANADGVPLRQASLAGRAPPPHGDRSGDDRGRATNLGACEYGHPVSQFQRPFAVVLAGGVGSRFWPASRPERPKQLLPLGSARPLIADTVERASALAGLDRTIIVAGAHLIDAIRHVLPELSPENFLVEPEPRGTGPALAWAAHEIVGREPNAVIVSLHADHVIETLQDFLDTTRAGVDAAGGGRLLCLGIVPDRPETGYGYVRRGEALESGVYEAAEFVEKPDEATARSYLESGAYLWNSGIFIWRAQDLIDAVRALAPEIALAQLDNGNVAEFFRSSEPISVDVAVMERSKRIGVVEASFQWDDVGGWNSLGRTRPPDARGNFVQGRAELVESEGNVVWSDDGKITLFGVHDLVVVHSGEHTFVTTREAVADMKRIFETVEAEQDSVEED